MSCSKPLPPFVFDSLYYLNRNQLERFSIVCRPLKNFIARYFHSKPYRVFHGLRIRGGSYTLINNGVQWNPSRDDYTTQHFLAGQKCNIDNAYYSFGKMHPYLGPTIRIKYTNIHVAEDTNYSQDHIDEMESISYLWRDCRIDVFHAHNFFGRIIAEDFLPILDSLIILQCQYLYMDGCTRISFKDYKVLYAVEVIEMRYSDEEHIDVWQQFLEQPGVKPVIVLNNSSREYIEKLLDRFSKVFSTAILPNAFKIVFVRCNAPFIEFRETNNTSGEVLVLKKGLTITYPNMILPQYKSYTLERSTI